MIPANDNRPAPPLVPIIGVITEGGRVILTQPELLPRPVVELWPNDHRDA